MNDNLYRPYSLLKFLSIFLLASALLFLTHNKAEAQCFPLASGVTVNYTITDLTCNGNGTGSVSITVLGGGAPYTFTILGSTISFQTITQAGNTFTFTNLPADPNFFINVQTKIAVGFAVCNFSGLAINEPAPITITSSVTDATCNLASDGAINLTSVSGGTGAYTYLWSTGAVTQNISGLTAGAYSVTITDANGCPQVFNFNVAEPAPIAITSTVVDATCNGGNDGSITLNTVTGGTAPYTFLWSTGAITQNISGLTAGAYSVTITDANGCPQVFNFNVAEPAPIAITSTVVDASCNGASNGSITLNTVTGGTAPYTFLWSTGVITQNISGLTAGAYSVTITDANGCPQVFNFNVAEPAPIAITSTVVDAACNGGATGSITLNTVTGGTAPYTFLWSTGAITQNIAGLTAGAYSVTITDANGCPQVFNFNVAEPTPTAITSTVVDATCNGGATGSITLNTVTGGTAPYTFLWSTGAITQNIAGLTAGAYSVTITDANGCPQVFNFNVAEPTPIAITSTVVDVSCNGASNGSITLNTVTGGTAPYTFLWSTGAITQNISGLTAGAYSVTITDANGCPQVFNFNVAEPAPITITSTVVDASCNGASNGSITLNTVTGGTAPYTFLWSTGAITQNISGLTAGAYSVTITDANACPQVFNFNVAEPAPITITSTVVDATCNGASNGSITLNTVTGGTAPYTFLWSTGAITQNISGLTAGAYSVTITDANGCPQVFNFNVAEPAPIAITSTVVDATCNGGNDGSITLNTVTGGTAPYTFLWSTGAITQNISGLTAGAYSVTITDANGCPQVFNFNVAEPAPIAITSTVVDATCNGGNDGSITLNTVTGGTAPYTFLWSTGAITQNISGLTAGAYSVTITDANGCPQVFNFNVAEPAPIAITSTVVDASCNGASNGSITLNTVTGGTAPYTFLWSTGAITQNISGLTAGAYSVTITDANGCPQVFNFNVAAPAVISITSTTSNVSCNSGSDGTITLTSITGGTAPYTFLWSTGAITQNISGLGAGSPFVTITDANGCAQVFNFNITEPPAVVITSTTVDVTCNGGNNGSITLNTVTGGNGGAYTFLWNTGATTQNIAGLSAGAYSVTVTDVLGCPISFNFNITEPSPIAITSTTANSSTCGGNDGAININTITGGTSPYTFLWSTGAVTQNISGLTAGAYSVTITDANGCPQVFNFSISDPTPFTVTAVVTDVTCNSANNGSIVHTITGGTAPFTILWNTGAVTQDLLGIAGGSYTVTITDASNCSYNGNYTINEPAAISITSITTNISTCGGNDGSITLTSVTGGIAPYTFLWNTGAVTQNISGLTAGAYSVTITDANACPQVFNFGLSDPTPFTVTAVVTDVTCNGANNGSIVHTITGGTAPFTILWNTGAVTQDLLGVAGGSYTVTITDASNCSYNGNYTINEPAIITITSSVSAITTCGGNDGTITLNTISGGTAPYTFLWSNGAITQNIAGLSAGSYTVTVTDANGCASTPFNFNLTDPVTFVVTSTTNDVTCNGGADGSINLNIVGGTLPFSFVWSTGASTQNISGLIAGTYNVTVTDAGGCTFIGSYTINEPTAVVITSSFTNVTCNGGLNGSITLNTVTGGVAPYTFLWNTGASTQNIAGLSAGAYSVTVSDANGCPQSINFNITEPVAMTDNATLTNVTSCGGNDGAITINAIIGGTPGYTFLWNTGATTQNLSSLTAGLYSVVVTDANTCTQNFSYAISDPVTFTVTPTVVDVLCNGNTTGSISLAIAGGTAPFTTLWNTGASTTNITTLVAGTYTVAITDATGCSFNGSYSVSEPSAITIVSTVTNTSSCGTNDGDITLTSISGGVAPYAFLWNTGAVTQNITGLASGAYSVTITDANSCPQTFGFAVSNPTPFTVVPSITNVPCNGGGGGAISLTITGGTAPISILWNTGSNSNSITNLAAGIYSVTVSDVSGCVFNGSYTLTEPSAVDTLSIVTTLSHVICPGSNEGSVLLSNITGGTPAYTYTLGGINSAVPNYTTLTAGTYTMTIHDANGCDFYHSFIITEPAPIAYTVSTTIAVCTGNNASLSFDPVTGGTPPYVYSIDGGITYSNQTNYTNLAPAIYSVFVRDANNCTYGYLVPIGRKQGPIPYIRSQSTTCFGGDDGAIIVDSVFSGVTPFTFYFNGQNRGSSKVFTSLISGNYTMMIEDQDCKYDITNYFLWNGVDYDTILVRDIFVNQPAQVTAEVSSVDTDRKNSTGVASVYNFSGGTFPYRYSLDTLQGYNPVVNDSVFLAGIDKGTYKVFLVDTNGCKGEVTVKVNVSFFIPNLITPNGDGQNDYFEIMALPRGSTLQIYNSWNERVYYNKNYDNSWDATGLSNSVYYYELALPNGKSYKGWIQTMR